MDNLYSLYESIVGSIPPGLEWLAFFFINLFLMFGLWLVYKILHEFFHAFDKH